MANRKPTGIARAMPVILACYRRRGAIRRESSAPVPARPSGRVSCRTRYGSGMLRPTGLAFQPCSAPRLMDHEPGGTEIFAYLRRLHGGRVPPHIMAACMQPNGRPQGERSRHRGDRQFAKQLPRTQRAGHGKAQSGLPDPTRLLDSPVLVGLLRAIENISHEYLPCRINSHAIFASTALSSNCLPQPTHKMKVL